MPKFPKNKTPFRMGGSSLYGSTFMRRRKKGQLGPSTDNVEDALYESTGYSLYDLKNILETKKKKSPKRNYKKGYYGV
jgi:hypothetical protein